VQPNQWHRCTRFDGRLDVLEAVTHEVSRRGAYALAVGSGEFPVKVRILGHETLPGGSKGLVRIYLPIPLPLLPGDRAILRDYGREETIGGIEILDIDPKRSASKAVPTGLIEDIVRERGWVELEHLTRLSPHPWVGDVVQSRWAVSAEALSATLQSIRTRTTEAGSFGLDPAQLDEKARAVLPLLAEGGLSLREGRIQYGEVRDPLADHPFIDALAANPFQPPDATGVERTELRELIRRKLVVEADGVWFAPSALLEAASQVAILFVSHPEGLTVAQIRDALATSRKYILPIVGWLDANGITRRRGDLRIPGPRLPEIANN
jgi:selenocysteine-specific elongation factor